jgi:hypothetical protein
VQTLDAFDWKLTISDTYFDLDVSFRQPNHVFWLLATRQAFGYVGVSHYHANTVHYNRSLVAISLVTGNTVADDSILITFPVKGERSFHAKRTTANLYTRVISLLSYLIIPNPTIKVAPKHEQLTTEFFVAV